MLQADGRTYLPLRSLSAEILGAQVEYDSIHGIVIIERGGSVIETFAGSNNQGRTPSDPYYSKPVSDADKATWQQILDKNKNRQ